MPPGVSRGCKPPSDESQYWHVVINRVVRVCLKQLEYRLISTRVLDCWSVGVGVSRG